jgi:hypothetical protein
LNDPPAAGDIILGEPAIAGPAVAGDGAYINPAEDDGQLLLNEPGYVMRTDNADAGLAAASGGASPFEIETAEPGYIVNEQDRTPDTVVAAAESGAADEGWIFNEPAYTGQGADAGLAAASGGASPFEIETAEPGYIVNEQDNAPDTVVAAAESGAADEGWIFNEPAYTRQEADAAAIADTQPSNPFEDGSVTDEPGYTITEESVGVGSGEEFPRDTVPPITVAQPDNPEYSSSLQPPPGRTDFPVSEPAVNMVENDLKAEREEVLSSFTPQFVPESQIPPAAFIETAASLEAGKYYVQIGGYANQERIEAIMGELGAYPLVLMGKRYILIGPLNEGESNALEQQFRVKGFPNAFVVKGNTGK